MGLPDYFARGAVAASQVLAGFDEERIATKLGDVRLGITVGSDALGPEGRALADLAVRLAARLYPVLAISVDGDQEAERQLRDLASRINPQVEFENGSNFEVVVGRPHRLSQKSLRIFIGSDGAHGLISPNNPRPLGNSANPFGPGVAACIGLANVFRAVFLVEPRLDQERTIDLALPGPDNELPMRRGKPFEVVLFGCGAIGNAALWALSRLPLEGVVSVVDHQVVELSNLQRYVLCERADELKPKTEVVSRFFVNDVRARGHQVSASAFLSAAGHRWQHMLLGLDTARDRMAAQASLPQWTVNAWTQPGDIGVASHDFLTGACVTCLYLPQTALENEDAILTNAFGVPDRLRQVRTLLHSGAGAPRDLLEAIAAARGIALGRLLPFEGRPVRTLYTEGFCGGAVIPLSEIGRPRADVHVPLAHQSALAGVLLAAGFARRLAGFEPANSRATRVDVLSSLPSHHTQPISKDPRGICICQDADYRAVYSAKYTPAEQAELPEAADAI